MPDQLRSTHLNVALDCIRVLSLEGGHDVLGEEEVLLEVGLHIRELDLHLELPVRVHIPRPEKETDIGIRLLFFSQCAFLPCQAAAATLAAAITAAAAAASASAACASLCNYILSD